MNARKKKKQAKIRNKKLVKRYPFLLPRNVWTGKISRDYDYSYTKYDCVPEGWGIAFGLMMLEELRDALIKHNYLHKYMITQIKEKYGTLRWYTGAAPEECHRIADKYEVISEHVCICCGKPDVGLVCDYGWVEPLCKRCYKNCNKNLAERVPYEKALVSDDNVMPDSYTIKRYYADSGLEEEQTIDISDTTAKIRAAYRKRMRRNGYATC